MEQSNFKEPFEFRSFSEIFYCAMARPRNLNLIVFIQCQYTRTILRNKIMGQSLFKKHSKFQNVGEICYCGMTSVRKTNLDTFIQRQYTRYTRSILRKENIGQILFEKHSEFLIFNKVFYCDMTKCRHE